jgi:hypothetical protein
MSRTLILTIVTALLIVPSAASLRADHAQVIGRHLGLGWGDGYHSHTACPPKRHPLRAALPPAPPQPAKALPWWMIPADSPENLPTPHDAPSSPATPNTGAPGTSLFRQPGDGSSVYSPTSPAIMR